MALTKDKLVTRLQTQIGMTKPESRQIVERLFAIMKETLADGEDLLISGFGKFHGEAEECTSGQKSSDQREFDAEGAKGFGV